MQAKSEREEIEELKKKVSDLTISNSLILQRMLTVENKLRGQEAESKHNVTPCNYNFFEPHNA